MDENSKKIKKYAYIISGIVFVIFVICFITFIVMKSKYRVLKSSMGFSLKFNADDYEYTKAAGNLDIIQIKDMSKADNDCYVYVGNYDPTQDLEDTLRIINGETGSSYSFDDVKIGTGSYPAKHVGYTGEKGELYNVYFVDYQGHNYVIQACSDKKHRSEIEKILKSFTVMAEG